MEANMAPEHNEAIGRSPEANTFAPEGLNLFEAADVGDAFERVWDGKATASLVGGALTKTYCNEVYQRFIASPARANRADGVPGDVVGATQYGKTAEEYMSLADPSSTAVKAIMGGPGSELQNLLRGLAKRMARRGVLMRPLIFDGEPAPMARFARWTTILSDGRWLLRPHEDWAQTRGYGEWEIDRVERIFAINFYVRSKPGSGQLVVTGWRPTDSDRASRGLEVSGYPYPDEDLLHRPHLTLPVGTGDIAIIDGSHLHGVLIGDGDIAERLIANLFVGRLGDSAVFWA
jgi:hypothetical protein